MGNARPGIYASIDIGTVTCRLLVAEVSPQGTLKELTRGYRITNLGEGVDATGVLKPEAMQRVADCVAGFQQQIASLSPDPAHPIRPHVVATSASRDAQNASEFTALLKGQGIELSIIPGKSEAALSFLGATADMAGERVLVVDAGGGSTEVIVGVGGSTPDATRSFDVGCRRMTERFVEGDTITEAEQKRARAWIREEMGRYFDALRDKGYLPARMVAVAGTATSVVSVREAMEQYDSRRVHGAYVSREDLAETFDRLVSCSLEERRQVVGLDPNRAPLICQGLIILQSIMDLAGLDGYTASEWDILQGLIMQDAGMARE